MGQDGPGLTAELGEDAVGDTGIGTGTGCFRGGETFFPVPLSATFKPKGLGLIAGLISGFSSTSGLV